jgi:hypothetical protein
MLEEMKRQKKTPQKPKYRVKDMVEVVGTTFEAGQMSIGDICTVTAIITTFGDPVYTLERDDKRVAGWFCCDSDIIPYDVNDKGREHKRFVRQFGAFLGSIPLCAGTERDRLQTQMNEAETTLSTCSVSMRALTRYLIQLPEEGRKIAEAKETQDKLKLLLDKMYESIIFVAGSIVVVTKPITVKSDDMTLSFGRYQFEVHYSHGIKMFARPDMKEHELYDRGGEGKYLHPHIKEGKPCLGEFQLPLVKATASQDYLCVLELAYRYLASVNKNDAFTRPLMWAEDRVYRCHTCMKLMNETPCSEHRRFNPVEQGDIWRGKENDKLWKSLIDADDVAEDTSDDDGPEEGE